MIEYKMLTKSSSDILPPNCPVLAIWTNMASAWRAFSGFAIIKVFTENRPHIKTRVKIAQAVLSQTNEIDGSQLQWSHF